MPKMRRILRSELSNDTETNAILNKIADLMDQSPTHVVIQKGNSFRFNGSQLGELTLDVDAVDNNLQFSRPPLATGQEQTNITCVADGGRGEIDTVTAVADTGVKARSIVTVPATTGATQADYFIFTNKAGTTWAVWLDIDAAGTEPTGAAYVAVSGGNKKKASIVTGGTAIQNAAAVRTAIGSSFTNVTVTDNLDATITFLQNKVGATTAPVPHNAGDSGSGSFTVSGLITGVSSNLNSKFFTFQPAVDTHQHYIWFNVNSEGVDPAPMGYDTGHAVTLAAGATASTVGAAIRTVYGTLSFATGSGSGASAILTGNYSGPSTETTTEGAAATGFTFQVTQTGILTTLASKYFTLYSAEDDTAYYVWFNINTEGSDPAVMGKTGIEVTSALGSSAADIAAAAAAAITSAASSDFTATSDSATLTITNVDSGSATDTADGTAATGFTILKTGELESYDTADIQIIRRIRTKKWLIKLSADASPVTT